MPKTIDDGINEFVQCLWDNGVDIGHRPVWTDEKRAIWNSIVKPIDQVMEEHELDGQRG